MAHRRVVVTVVDRYRSHASDRELALVHGAERSDDVGDNAATDDEMSLMGLVIETPIGERQHAQLVRAHWAAGMPGLAELGTGDVASAPVEPRPRAGRGVHCLHGAAVGLSLRMGGQHAGRFDRLDGAAATRRDPESEDRRTDQAEAPHRSSVDRVRRLTAIVTVTAAMLLPVAPAHAAPGRLINHLRGIHNAEQVIAVTTSGYGTSYATFRAFRKTANGWRRVFGPWSARIGYNGFARRGAKREGDGRTPTGSFHFQYMFGVYADPGVHYRYRPALRTSYWDDDSSSANYNRWVDSRYDATGRNPEPMHVSPAYNYGAVIGYNLSRTPGLGSAIFLHVSHNSATAGCVSIGQTRVVKVLRWLRPGLHPRIIMGTRAAVT